MSANASSEVEQRAPEPQPAELLPAPLDGTRLDHPRHETFARLTLSYSLAEAYRRAMGENLRAKPSSVREAACALAARPDIKRRVAELKAAAARESAIEVGELARELKAIAEADISELIYRGCCRYCHGDGHRYQHVDAEEFTLACAKALDDGHVYEHSDLGGYGYNGSLRPAEDCPQCFGGGDQWFTADLSRVSTPVRRLVKGVGKHGELLFVDPLVVRDQLHRLLGGYIDRSENVNITARVAAPSNVTTADVLAAFKAVRE